MSILLLSEKAYTNPDMEVEKPRPLGFPKEGAAFTGLEFRAGPAKNPTEHET